MSLFKPKTHGYGAAPTDWRGWAAIAAFGVAEMAVLGLGLGVPLLRGMVPTVGLFLFWMAVSVVMTLGFLWWVRRNTEGDWRWRWGKDE
ncbi:MAG: hypothetical protein KDE08_06330 [Rhodobacteraceae bacterium]|nr:hypothetical protein [Paracoccaceae bacterium]